MLLATPQNEPVPTVMCEAPATPLPDPPLTNIGGFLGITNPREYFAKPYSIRCYTKSDFDLVINQLRGMRSFAAVNTARAEHYRDIHLALRVLHDSQTPKVQRISRDDVRWDFSDKLQRYESLSDEDRAFALQVLSALDWWSCDSGASSDWPVRKDALQEIEKRRELKECELSCSRQVLGEDSESRKMKDMLAVFTIGMHATLNEHPTSLLEVNADNATFTALFNQVNRIRLC